MKELKLLPIGVQTFLKMRSNPYVYVDKTEHAYRLAITEGMYFLSRPRRFGKSLMVSTLRELFEGNRVLFKGLWIEDKWDWLQKNPVIQFSFDRIAYKELGLDMAIKLELKTIAEKYGILYKTDSYQQQFRELIENIYQQYGKVVILVDEYDKPIIDFLEKEDLPQAKINQKIIKNFYSVLKSAEACIRFLFITGVSKFAQVSLFSDLNHLNDLTLHPNFATITGYTQAELEANFDEHIEAVRVYQKVGKETLLEELKDWYNGFSWDGTHTLYNPFGTLNFLAQKTFKNFWFTTGTPTFLINLIKEHGVFKFEKQWISYVALQKYDLDNLGSVPLMFQTGYLTIKELDIKNGNMLLDYPNREVRDGMYQLLLDDLTRTQYSNNEGVSIQNLSKAFNTNDLENVQLIINSLFADLPAPLYEPKNPDKRKELELSERFFHGVIHLIFKYLGVFIESEVYTSFGRADSVVITATHIYVFEFKYNRSGKAAFSQIEKKNYAEKYRATGKKLVGIGVNFSHITRRINGWVIKDL
jgi:Predicted AAA-ATPase/PD-(D/E)XK nuclease superfamily